MQRVVVIFMPISREDFVSWALSIGASQRTVDLILRYEPTKENYPDYDDWLNAVCGPMKNLDYIRSTTLGDIPDVYPLKAGFMFVGSCGNGDPIAIDLTDDVDSVWYLDLPNMYRGKLRSVAIRVADDLEVLMKKYEALWEGESLEGFPLDYHRAKKGL